MARQLSAMDNPLLSIADLYDYQKESIIHALRYPESMNWCPLGRGKTIISLTTITARMNRLEVYGTLVLATKAIIQTVWADQAKEWEHTKHLTFSMVDGKPDERLRGLRVDADIYLAHYGNLPWIADALEHLYLSKGKVLPFNMVVYDEVTKLKTASGPRHAAARRITPYTTYRMGLTGTPASNGYKDLYGQFLAVDQGDRLGTTDKAFKAKYFEATPGKAYAMRLQEGAKEKIKAKIADITFMVDDSKLKQFPPFVANNLWLSLPDKVQAQYDELEREMLLKLDEDVTIEVSNRAVLTNKCLQAANGALYKESGVLDFALMHDVKLNALVDLVESAGEEPLFVMYAFKHDLARIKEKFPEAEHFHGGMSSNDFKDLRDRWNRKEVPLLLGHPASVGHGLNLQYGGHHIVWYGVNWSLDLYLQANGRLRRDGQENPVILTRLLMSKTLDEAVVQALRGKSETQEELKATINSYRQKKLNRN